jgi:eukaryotic-like serine/threonine-protein kinase
MGSPGRRGIVVRDGDGPRSAHDRQRPVSDAPADRYVVDAQIGRGGTATVWRAHDTVLNRTVALKRLQPGLREDAESMARFSREARTVARLSHPGIVRLLDMGEDDEGPYLVMELVDGEDLKTRIAREGPMAPREAARIGAQVASTLAFAHRHGVIHRDIKSQNVLLDRAGNAKLADFGIAQLLEVSGESRLTRSGMMVGTSDYLAPEQAEGRPVDGRTDTYSLGIVLWECLTGELPFPGENFVAVAMRQLKDPLPDPRTRAPEVPARLAEAVLRAAAKNPDDRFASAEDFAAELDACVDDPAPSAAPAPAGAPAAPARPRAADARAARRRTYRRRRAVALAVALAVVALIAWALDAAFSGSASAPPVRPLAFTVTSYDPQGDGTENPGDVRYVTDGNVHTAWYTELYGTSPTYGGIKQGVGLLIAVHPGFRATRLDLRSPTPGAAFQIRAPGKLSGPPLVGTTRMTGAAQTLALPAAAPADLVIWIVRLVPDPAVTGGYWAGISEVSVLGVPKN